MFPFTAFNDMFSTPIDSITADIAAIDCERFKIPDTLKQLWHKDGFGGYADDFIWTINPEEFIHYLELGIAMEATPFLRTSFADILFFIPQHDKYSFNALNLRHKEIIHIATCTMEDFFNITLLEYGFLFHYLRINLDLYWFAYEKLGAIDHEFCYGYHTTPANGGIDSPENVGRFDLHTLLINETKTIQTPISKIKLYE